MLQLVSTLRQPPPGMAVDFTSPQGAPELTPAHGISWEIFDNPVSLFIGGVAAVLLELAKSSVRAAVDMTPKPARSFASLRGHSLGRGQRARIRGALPR